MPPYLWVLLFCALPLSAQRAYEQRGDVIYEDSHGKSTSLGRGYRPMIVAGGNVLFIRAGLQQPNGDRDCKQSSMRDRVALYDVRTKKESVIYDKPIPNKFYPAYSFEQADLSPSGSTLYIVTPYSATSGRLAIVQLSNGTVRSQLGVQEVYVIRGGPSAGDLIYSRRLLTKHPDEEMDSPRYPFVHAKPDGTQVAIISEEGFTVGKTEPTPILRSYLRHIGGRIYAQEHWLP